MRKGNILFEIEDFFVKKVVKSGNGCIAWIPKRYKGRNAVILIVKSKLAARIGDSSEPQKLPLGVCAKCKKPLSITVRPDIRARMKDSDFCHCQYEKVVK